MSHFEQRSLFLKIASKLSLHAFISGFLALYLGNNCFLFFVLFSVGTFLLQVGQSYHVYRIIRATADMRKLCHS